MKVKQRTIIACTIYLVLIFILAFFLSSIKNHYYVIGKNYIAKNYISFSDFIKVYFPMFWNEYNKTLLLFLIPLILVNCIFIIAIIRMNGKNMFNCIVSIVLVSSAFEWLSFHINHGNNLMMITMFAAFMLFIIVMEFAVRLCSKKRLSFIYPFVIGISINMYFGIFIFSTFYRIYNFVPLIVLVVILYSIRCLSSLINIDSLKTRILFCIMLILSVALFFIILGLAGYDYFARNDPHHKIWQQLYYVVVYSAFFGVYIMQYLVEVLYVWDDNADDVEKKRKLTLIINSILLIIIPILCVFAIHGIVLIISNGIMLLLNFFFVLKKPFDLKMKGLDTHLTVGILFTVVTFIYMAIDPIFYLDASKHISMIWPMIVCVCSLGAIVIAITPILFANCNEKIAKSIKVFNEMKKSFNIKIQVFLCIINVILLGMFATFYTVKDYANQSRTSLDVGFIDQKLEGFGGLYLLSWCIIPVFLNALFFMISIVCSMIKRMENSQK